MLHHLDQLAWLRAFETVWQLTELPTVLSGLVLTLENYFPDFDDPDEENVTIRFDNGDIRIMSLDQVLKLNQYWL